MTWTKEQWAEYKHNWKIENAELNREHARRYRETHREEIRARDRARKAEPAHPLKLKARHKINHAIEKGAITRPDICSECENECIPQAHHNDYSLPLEIEWLCRSCHGRRHRLHE